MNAQREKEIRDRLDIVISHIEADMALDLLEELDQLRVEHRKLQNACDIFIRQCKEAFECL
jgi:hypothetical protein